MQPTVDQGLCGLLGTLVVAPHHLRPLNQQLSVLGNLDRSFLQGAADRTEAHLVDTVQGQGGTGFGQSVAFEGRDTDDPHELVDRLVERCAARNEKSQAATELLANSAKDEAVGQAVFHPQKPDRLALHVPAVNVLTADLDRLVKQPAFDRVHQVDVFVNARIDLLEESRHADHGRGPDLEDVFHHLVDALGKSHMAPVHEGGVVAGGALEHVTQGQETEKHLCLVHPPEFPHSVVGIHQHVGLGQHDPLGNAGGTGCVDNRDQVVGRDAVDVGLNLPLLLLIQRMGNFG